MSTTVAASLLSWVKTEVDYALKTVRDNIARFSAAPEEVAALRICPDQLHQVRGTLNILGLNGATRFCETIEHAFAGFGKDQRPSKAAIDIIDRAVVALKGFIDGLAKGEANAPIRLFPLYRELSVLQGRTDASDKELFFPDLKLGAPPHPASRTIASEKLSGLLQAQRSRFQRGMLAWLRNPSDPHGPQEMHQALDGLDQVASQLPEPRSLWWAATGLVDGLLHPPRAEWAKNAKSICSRLDLRMRDIAAGTQAPGEPLLRELLYALASCRPLTARIAEVKQLYRLDSLFPEPSLPESKDFDMARLEPTLHDIRLRLEIIKSTWVQYISNEPRTLSKFREEVAALKARINELGNHHLVRLLDAIALVSTRLPDPHPGQSQLMVTEMASAFLLIENIVDNITDTPPDLEQQIAIMGGWLLDAAKGKSTGQLPAGLRADISQEIGKIQLQAQVAREILNNLQRVEQVLDAFARDANKRDSLLTLPPYLKQIHGALAMLAFRRASELLSVCEDMIAACARDDHAASAQDMDWIAEGLSSLGFFLDPCLHGRPPAGIAIELFFDRFEKRATTPPQPAPDSTAQPPAASATDAAAADHAAPVVATATAVPANPVVEPASRVAPAAPVNDELLGIYLEEAEEVLANIDQALSSCRSQPDNPEALTTIRRGFHTLKGSGRMVGLTDLGEVAWEIEQVMNRWLKEPLPATPALLELIAASSTSFAAWIKQLKSREQPKIDAQHILALAQQLTSSAAPDTAAPAAAAAPEPEVAIGDVHLSRPFYDIYLKEAQQHLSTLETEFKTWRDQPGAEASHELTRAAHTLASISRTAGLGRLADLAAALEQCLPHARLVVKENDVLSIDAAITRLREMLTSISQQEPPSGTDHVLTQLQALITRLQTPQASLPYTFHTEPPAPAAVQAPPAASSEDAIIVKAAAFKQKDQRAIRDDLDPQLLPIFLEEAQELLPLIGADLRNWKVTPADAQIPESLKRALHTFKGSARMAGAMRLGELAHLMESSVEAALESGALPAAMLSGEFESQMDRLSEGIERLRGGGSDAAVPQPAQSATQHAADTTRAAAPRAEPPLPAPAAMLRINAETLDRLVNEAGEVGIARSRIEGELHTLKQSLLELNDSVARLRGQLREVEIQADSQMQSRLSVMDADKHDFDPLEFDRYTRLQELTRMMVESLHDVSTIQQTLLKNAGEVDAAVLQQARINRDLQQELMRTRTVPFSNLNERLYRIVRQTARELDKKASLEIRDSHVELDRSVLEKISAPLEHMLRNAIGHGLENQDERRAANKPPAGEITVTLRQESNEIVIIVSDDGAGLDIEKLRKKALEKGLIETGREATDAELIPLIFTPGFSTADEITELSGRGVGMDVVRSEIAAIGGRIETTTARGKGTTFTIYLPLTLAVTQAVLVRGGNHTFAVSSAMVEQVLRLKSDALPDLYERGLVESQGQTYPLHYLQQLLGADGSAAELRNYNSVLLLRSGIQRVALHVDELIGNQEIVVKNINPQLARVAGIAGATVLGNGKIVLIINPVQLAQRVRAARPAIAQPVVSKPAARIVMVVDDSLTVRKITSRLLEREGYQVLTAKDGVDALEQIKDTLPDIMLVDIEMPRMDGFDLTRNIRHDPRTAGIPIIMISSRTAEKHRSHADQLGVDVFLGKPYQEAELLQHVSQFMTRARQHGTLH